MTTQEVVDAIDDVTETSAEVATDSDAVADAAESQRQTVRAVAERLDSLSDRATDLERTLDQFVTDLDGPSAGEDGSTVVRADGDGSPS